MPYDSKSGEVTVLTSVSPPPERVEQEERRAHLIVLSGSNVGQVYPLAENDTTIGREDGSSIQLLDAGISRRHARLQRRSSGTFELYDAGSRNGTFVNNARVEATHLLDDGDKIQVGMATILKFSYDDELEARYAQRMYDAALRDGLTGAFNRRYFDERLRAEVAFSQRHGASASLLLIDLDHFKRVNDTHGHLAGDQILKEFAQLVGRIIRAEDVLARYGGEEFGIVCRNTDLAQAAILAERVRHAAAKRIYTVDEAVIRVTVSLGVAAVPDSQIKTAEQLVDAADAALYRAKAQGRNCVICHRRD